MLTAFFVIVLLIVALFAIAWAEVDGSYWWFLVAVIAIVTALAAVNAEVNQEEDKCRDRGGEVVHYGKYGTGVDCINVPK